MADNDPASELGGLAEHAESLCQMLHPGKTHDQSTTDTLVALARRDAQEAAMTYTELDRAYDAATLDASKHDPNWNKPRETTMHSDSHCVTHCSPGHKHSQCGCPCRHTDSEFPHLRSRPTSTKEADRV